MFEQINEPVEMVGIFVRGTLKPYKFSWGGRTVLVKSINLAWSAWEGRSKLYYFSVSDDFNHFKLCFNSGNLTWVVLEIYAD